jgi:ATP-dependent Lhr-like helicase
MPERDVDALLDHMVARGLLFEEAGILSVGPEGERSFGYRNFLELFSVFNSPPLVTVRYGRAELGQVHEVSFHTSGGEQPILLLAGQSWAVTHIDWRARVAYVTPSVDAGRSRWLGEGQALSFRLCRAIQGVLAGAEVRGGLSRRAREHLARLRARFSWVEEGRTALVTDASGTTRWWTFAGLRANTALGTSLKPLMEPRGAWGNLVIPLRPEAKASDVRSVLGDVAAEALIANVPVSDTTIDGLKFSVCLPAHLARRVLHGRMADVEGTRACLEQPIVGVTVA